MFDDNLLFKSNTCHVPSGPEEVGKVAVLDELFAKYNHCHLPGGPAGGQLCSDSGGGASGSFSPFVPAPMVAPNPNPKPVVAAPQSVADFVASGKAMDAGIASTSAELQELDALEANIAKNRATVQKYFDEMHKTKDPAAEDKIWAKMDKIDKEIARDQDRRTAILAKPSTLSLHNSIEAQIGRTGPQFVQFKYDGLAQGSYAHDTSRMGSYWVSKMIGDGGVPPGQHPRFQETTPKTRAHADSNNGIFMYHNSDTGTAVYEMGHWLEFSRHDVHQAAVGFLNQRFEQARGSPTGQVRPLAALVGGSGYAKNEIAFADKFANAYSGKIYATVYPNGKSQIHATEIVSMGMERMYRNPMKFRHEDPEYYHFTMGVMKHVAHTPSPGRVTDANKASGKFSYNDISQALAGGKP